MRFQFAMLFGLAVLAAPSATQAQDRLKVVTTFAVLADMAAKVAGDALDVVSITKPGAKIHGYEPTPGDIVGAMNADLILWNGMGLEIWFEQFLANLGAIPSATLTDGIIPNPITEGSYLGKPNPHAGMGLDNALIYVANIEKALSAADPANATTYWANAAAYSDALRATLEPLRVAIGAIPEAKRWPVT